MKKNFRATEETYTFSDGTSFTKTGGTYAAGDVTWSAPFTSWKVLSDQEIFSSFSNFVKEVLSPATSFQDNQPKDDETNRELQDCVRTDENGK